MDLALILKAVLALSAIGVVASALLAGASRRFAVEIDQRVDDVLSTLPGLNCGACGNPLCFAAAEAMVSLEAPVTACTAGGQPVADAVADVLGIEKCAVTSSVSVRHCGGGRSASKGFEYSGVMSCNAAVRVAGGDLVCPFGCLGYGDCARACPFEAITMDARGLPVVDLDLCTGCEVCVAECPRGKGGLLAMASDEAGIAVRCVSHDRVKQRKAYCSTCCISCRKCEKVCPADAIHVIDMVAVVDHDKCTVCGQCIDICPQECIDLTGRFMSWSVEETDGRGPKVTGFEAEPLPGTQGEAGDA